MAHILTVNAAPRSERTTSEELRAEMSRLVAVSLAEDVGAGDVTSRSIISSAATCRARVVARAAGVVAGLGFVESIYRALPDAVAITPLRHDGDQVESGTELMRIEGNATTILTGERAALNFLGHLSGVATLTRAYVDAVRGTGATVLDTRKTTPGMRYSEKYAVRCGGATNHRLGLHDAVLIKDNHLLLSGTLENAVARARASTDLEITVEVETLAEVSRALDSGVDRILLDNMSTGLMQEAVELVSGRVPLEASGGVNLDSIAEIANTGVDFVSVGSLTHSAPALDVSLEVEKQ